MADSFPELSESNLNMKTNLLIEWKNNYIIIIVKFNIYCYPIIDKYVPEKLILKNQYLNNSLFRG